MIRIKKDKLKKIDKGTILGGGILALSLFLLLTFWSMLPAQLPWFYSLPWGEEQLIDKWAFLVFLIALAGIFGLDVWIGSYLKKKDKPLGSIAIWFGVAIVVVYLASFYQVLWIMI